MKGVKKVSILFLTQSIINILISFTIVKRQIYFLICNIIALFVIIQVIEVYGNGIVFEPLANPVLSSFLMIIVFTVGTTLEYVIFKYSENEIYSEPKGILSSFFKINLVTFPLTQILAYIFYIYFLSMFWFYVFVIEVLVVVIEWFLLRIELNNSRDLHLKSNKILFDTIIANLVSFLFGLIIYLPSFL